MRRSKICTDCSRIRQNYDNNPQPQRQSKQIGIPRSSLWLGNRCYRRHPKEKPTGMNRRGTVRTISVRRIPREDWGNRPPDIENSAWRFRIGWRSLLLLWIEWRAKVFATSGKFLLIANNSCNNAVIDLIKWWDNALLMDGELTKLKGISWSYHLRKHPCRSRWIWPWIGCSHWGTPLCLYGASGQGIPLSWVRGYVSGLPPSRSCVSMFPMPW